MFSNPAVQLQVCHNKVELNWVESSAHLHSRPTPAAPLVTTTQVLRSQPAWNSSDENLFRTTQLQAFTYRAPHISDSLPCDTIGIELEYYSKHFQDETENVLLHYVVFIVSRDPRAYDFVI